MKRKWTGRIALALAIGFVGLMYFAPKPTEAERRTARAEAVKAEIAERCANEPMFFVMAQKFVTKALRAPSSADFPSSASSTVRVAECRYVVTSYVDAQNSFGATIRTTWGVDIEYLPGSDTYQAHNVAVQ